MNFIVIRVIKWITGVKTIKRQTRTVHGCLVAGSNSCGRGLGLRPIDCTPTLSVTQKRRCSCGMPLVALQFAPPSVNGLSSQQQHPRGMLCLVLSVLPHQCYSSEVNYKCYMPLPLRKNTAQTEVYDKLRSSSGQHISSVANRPANISSLLVVAARLKPQQTSSRHGVAW